MGAGRAPGQDRGRSGKAPLRRRHGSGRLNGGEGSKPRRQWMKDPARGRARACARGGPSRGGHEQPQGQQVPRGETTNSEAGSGQ